MNRKIIGIALISILAVSCQKENNNKGIALGAYPLEVGNEWEYAIESSLKGEIHPDSVRSRYYKRYIRSVANTFVNGEACKKVLVWGNNLSFDYIDTPYVYYANRKDGLYKIGASEQSMEVGSFLDDDKTKASDIFAAANKYSFIPLVNSSLSSPKEFISPVPLHLIKLPLIIQKPWFSNEYGAQFNVQRVWIGYEDITVPAGTFSCVKLQLIFEKPKHPEVTGENPTVYQYFSEKGLVKEEFLTNGHMTDGNKYESKIITQLVKCNF